MKKLFLTLLLLVFTFSVMAQEYIPMKREPSGIYTIPCEVNGLKLRFVLDTGASTITLSLTEAVFMYKNGYIQDADIIGKTHVTLADGSIQENDKVKLKTVKIGSVILKDIIATIVNNTKAPLLLGQTVLSKIGTWTIHNNNLVLNDVANSENLSVEEAINRANLYLKNDKIDNAIKTIQPFLKYNIPEVLYLYGEHIKFADNYTDEKEEVECINALEELAKQGDARACRVLGYYYLKSGNNPSAILYFEKTENSEYYLDALINLAGIYLTQNNEDKELECLIKAAGLGYTQSYIRIAQIYESENKFQNAITWLNKAIQLNNDEAKYTLANIYIKSKVGEQNISKGIELLKQCKVADAYYDLAYMYLFGINVEENIEEATFWNHKLLGYIEYKHMHHLLSGLIEDKKGDYNSALHDLEYGFDFLKTTRISGWIGNEFISGMAYLTLGNYYEKGIGGAERDGMTAFNYYDKAIKCGIVEAYGSIGDLFVSGDLMEEDLQIAYEYYLRGANNNDGYCCKQIYNCYKNGIVVKKDIKTANKWLMKAKSLGFE